MKRILISILALTLSAGLMAQLSCYDIQFTEDISGDSPYKNQSVTVQGIVTAKRSGAFYIGDAGGGPWSGLYVYHGITSGLVEVGDMVKLTGTVEEYNNLTELTNVSASEVLSGNNPVPITTISTADLPLGGRVGEPYEGVMVRFNDVQIKSAMDTYGVYKIADSSNALTSVDDTIYLPQASQIVVGEWWSQIQGVVDYFSGAGGYRVLPRNANDMIKVDDVSHASIRIASESNAIMNQVNTLNVYTSKLKSEYGIREYEMTFRIDPNQVLYQGFEISGSLSQFNPTQTISTAGDIITLHYGGQDNLVSETDNAVLIKLKFEPRTYGDLVIYLDEFRFDDVNINSLTNGKLLVKISGNKPHLSIGTDQSGKNIFDPAMNEKINIEFGTKTGFLARAVIRIYDAQGRLVATPVHQNFTSPTGIERISWNGRDSNMKLLPPGLYYCHAEVSNRETGTRHNTVQPIVIKTRLK